MPILITGYIKHGGTDLDSIMQLLQSDINFKVFTCLQMRRSVSASRDSFRGKAVIP